MPRDQLLQASYGKHGAHAVRNCRPPARLRYCRLDSPSSSCRRHERSWTGVQCERNTCPGVPALAHKALPQRTTLGSGGPSLGRSSQHAQAPKWRTTTGPWQSPNKLSGREQRATHEPSNKTVFSSARPALSPRSSPSLLVALFLPLLSFPAFAQLSNKRLSPPPNTSRDTIWTIPLC